MDPDADLTGPRFRQWMSTGRRTSGPPKRQRLHQSSKVQVVVDLFAPTDLTDFDDQAVWWARGFVQLTMGSSTSTRPKASPVTWVAPTDPPFMILQGKDDTAVPPSQSAALARRLTAAGVPTQLVLVDHAGHGLASAVEEPAAAMLTDRVVAFFDATLQ